MALPSVALHCQREFESGQVGVGLWHNSVKLPTWPPPTSVSCFAGIWSKTQRRVPHGGTAILFTDVCLILYLSLSLLFPVVVAVIKKQILLPTPSRWCWWRWYDDDGSDFTFFVPATKTLLKMMMIQRMIQIVNCQLIWNPMLQARNLNMNPLWLRPKAI